MYFCFFIISLNCPNFQFNEEARSPFVKKHKTILHPGEVCTKHICKCLAMYDDELESLDACLTFPLVIRGGYLALNFFVAFSFLASNVSWYNIKFCMRERGSCKT